MRSSLGRALSATARRASVLPPRPAVAVRSFRLASLRLDAPKPAAAAASSTASSHANDLTPVNLKTTENLAVAMSESLQKQADTGKGGDLIKPAVPAGTINVTIAGESAPISEPSIKRPDRDWTLMHPLWHGEYVNRVTYTHLPPEKFVDKFALNTIRLIRFNFDWMSGYSFGKLTESKALTRIVFLETVAGVPGSVASTLRHLASLRRMKRDGGWINSLMSEAENERMHLLTFLQIRQGGNFMRAMVFLTQGLFFNFFWVSYLISPRFCHRLVGYLEEEAVATYTKILKEIDGGELRAWKNMPAPPIAIKYWSLKPDATVADVVVHVRADEAHHRDVNHTLASLKHDDLNPFRDGHA